MNKLNKFIILVISLFSLTVKAGTLEDVKSRGYLKCGISDQMIGFAFIDNNQSWSGFDVDMCRAVAAAIFGDSLKVEFITTTSRSRFPILASGEIDMLSRVTTWTFSRDVNLGFEFTGINFYDGQGFIVPKSLGVVKAQELEGATVCIQVNTIIDYNIKNFFNKHDIKYNEILIETDDEAIENYKVGRCDVYSTYITNLANLRAKMSKPEEHIILPEIISKEPLGPLVRHGDHEWGDIVRWSLNVMIIAEELGLTSENIDKYLESDNYEVLRLLGVEGAYGDMIELDYNWAYNIIKQVGDYGSVFERNIGLKSTLGLKRGLNSLWTDGGLLYAPPFR